MLEKRVVVLEGGVVAVATASESATANIYGGTNITCREFGIQMRFIDAQVIAAAIDKHIAWCI
ncbi:hypothetical protein B0H19DRAFT_1252987 [Mycena capillaripes]|nr:hypothetical protein B0H19DRAFT_1252987 [Mycena capillaripes]